MLPKTYMIARNGPPPDLAEKNVRGRRPAGADVSHSEEKITPELSLAVAAVLAAITILAQDLSSLPLILYQRVGKVKRRGRELLLWPAARSAQSRA